MLRERAVLSFNCVRVALRHAARLAGTVAMATMASGSLVSSSHADGIALGGCVGAAGSLNCVVRWGEAGDPYIRTVPPPADDAERRHSAERDRKWEERCRPVIRQDRFGVARYSYAAPGCEFGVIE